MQYYKEITFTIAPYSEAICDALIAELGNIGYDGFSYTDNGFSAYIPSTQYDHQAIISLPSWPYFSENFQISIKEEDIENQDWNKVWEENFTPIVVDNQIQVRAGFHEPVPGIAYEIIIEPKMSFGTGHHATTALMLKTILEYKAEISGKRLLDMGCGTGILSIMARKAGAQHVTGIDIDDWAYRNAMENIRNNGLDQITIRIGDAALLKDEENFDIVLANINRNILLNDMEAYVEKLNPQGYLIMSGFYLHDLPMIREKAESLGLIQQGFHEENQWVAASFYKK